MNNREHEQEFLEEKRLEFPDLQMEDLRIEWFTFLCHEELVSQGDTDEHMWLSHGIEINDIRDEFRIRKNKKPNLILKEATNLKELSEKSVDLIMESWHESAVANSILLSDIGRSKDKIRPEKSMQLLNAISIAIGTEAMETFKINLGIRLGNAQKVSTSFSCTWSIIEKTIQDTLGKSANRERLNKCMKDENWSGFTLQQTLQNISNFHEMNLNSKKMAYKNESGEVKDYEMHKKSMKILSALKLTKQLPDKFSEIKYDLETNMSDAYYNPEIKYEDIIKEIERKIISRGQFMLYSETKIQEEKALKEPETKKKKEILISTAKIENQNGEEQILEFLKNTSYRGPLGKCKKIAKIVRESNLCEHCLMKSCKQKQNKKTKTHHAKNYQEIQAMKHF